MITLDRFKQDENGTFGMLIADDGEQLCFTAELPWKDNQHEISCIPNGTYPVIKWSSPKVPKGFRIENVPNRDLIDIHCGNNPLTDSLGCIIVGTSMQVGQNAVLNSHVAMDLLYSKLSDSFELVITGGET